MKVSSRAVEVVDGYRTLVGQLPRGEYSTASFPTTVVDTGAVQAVKGPNLQKHHRTL